MNVELPPGPLNGMVRQVPVVRFAEGGRSSKPDAVAVEEPLEIRLNGEPVGAFLRTPGHDRELAVGLAHTEGLLSEGSDLASVAGQPGEPNIIHVRTRTGGSPDPWSSRLLSSGACGLCGRKTIEEVRLALPAPGPPITFSRDLLLGLKQSIEGQQPAFYVTGGIHAAALFDGEGNLLDVKEDIGRHNAVDKVIGAAFLAGRTPLYGHLLFVGGRAGFEIAQKALMGGVSALASVSAPSSLAVDLAQETGMLLVGFLRPGRFNVYSAPERVSRGPREMKSEVDSPART